MRKIFNQCIRTENWLSLFEVFQHVFLCYSIESPSLSCFVLNYFCIKTYSLIITATAESPSVSFLFN